MGSWQHWLRHFARLLKVQLTTNEGMSNDAPPPRPYVSVWEKWYIQSKATEMCEFCAKIPAFYGHLQQP